MKHVRLHPRQSRRQHSIRDLVVVRVLHPEHHSAIIPLKPREHSVLQHSVPFGRNPCRHRSAGTLQNVRDGFTSDGDGSVEDHVGFGAWRAPDDVEEGGSWRYRAMRIGRNFAESQRVREASLAALLGDMLS